MAHRCSVAGSLRKVSRLVKTGRQILPGLLQILAGLDLRQLVWTVKGASLMRIPAAIVVVLQFLLLVGFSHAGPATVGNLGETTRFQFSGNETFTSNQIRSELGANLDVLLACHPDAPRDELLNLIGYE